MVFILANKMMHLQKWSWLPLPSTFGEDTLRNSTNLFMDDRLNIDLLNGNVQPDSLSNSLCDESRFPETAFKLCSIEKYFPLMEKWGEEMGKSPTGRLTCRRELSPYNSYLHLFFKTSKILTHFKTRCQAQFNGTEIKPQGQLHHVVRQLLTQLSF